MCSPVFSLHVHQEVKSTLCLVDVAARTNLFQSVLCFVSSVDSYTEVLLQRNNRVKTIKRQYKHEEVTSGEFVSACSFPFWSSENNSSVYILSVLLPVKRADLQRFASDLSRAHMHASNWWKLGPCPEDTFLGQYLFPLAFIKRHNFLIWFTCLLCSSGRDRVSASWTQTDSINIHDLDD